MGPRPVLLSCRQIRTRADQSLGHPHCSLGRALGGCPGGPGEGAVWGREQGTEAEPWQDGLSELGHRGDVSSSSRQAPRVSDCNVTQGGSVPQSSCFTGPCRGDERKQTGLETTVHSLLPLFPFLILRINKETSSL